jgi:glycosyltransferase involved in cell wall biosynthesis
LDVGISVDGDRTERVVGTEGNMQKGVRLLRKQLGMVSRTLGSAREPIGRSRGINVVGFASAETGLGEAMRGTVEALQTVGREPTILDLSSRIPVRRRGLAGGLPRNLGTPMDVTIFHLNPTELRDYSQDTLAYRLAADRNVGFFFWETEQIPSSWLHGCDMVDEIWVGSTYLMKAFREVTSKPIHVMGMAVEAPATATGDRSRFGIEGDEFVVSYITDAYSGLQRKDPMRAIDAFELAFGPAFEGVRLVLKISNLEKFPGLRARLDERTRGKPVTIIAGYIDRDALWDLLGCSDVYLSLHSSEGFGLTILEAMALGIPPVVTGYGGNMDFTNHENSRLVSYKMTPASGGPGNIYAGNGMWADPDLSEASRHLAALKADRELRDSLGSRAQQTALEYGAHRYRNRIETRLQALLD